MGGNEERREVFAEGMYAVGEGSPATVRRCDRREDGLWIPRQSPTKWDFWTVVAGSEHEDDEDPDSLSNAESVAVIPQKNERGLAHARLFAASPALYNYVKRWAKAGDAEAQRLVEAACEGSPPVTEGEELGQQASDILERADKDAESADGGYFEDGLFGGIYGLPGE